MNQPEGLYPESSTYSGTNIAHIRYIPNIYNIRSAAIITQEHPYNEGELYESPIRVIGSTTMFDHLPREYWKDYYVGGDASGEFREEMLIPHYLTEEFRGNYPKTFAKRAQEILENNSDISLVGATYRSHDIFDSNALFPSTVILKKDNDPLSIRAIPNFFDSMNSVFSSVDKLLKQEDIGEEVSIKTGWLKELFQGGILSKDGEILRTSELFAALRKFRSRSPLGIHEERSEKAQIRLNTSLVNESDYFSIAGKTGNGEVIMTIGNIQKCTKHGIDIVLPQ